MRKVLFIAYQFPPMGGPGVHRSIRFVKHLRDFGYEPVVLTITEDDITKSGSTIDHSLLNEIPSDIEIHRVSSGIPFKFTDLLRKLRMYRLFWYFLYPLFWERSARFPSKAIHKAKELIRNNDIQVVYTSSGPFSPLKLGMQLKQQTGAHWVADLRDPFTDAYAWSYPSKWHWLYCKMIEKKWLEACDKLIVNTPEVKKLYIKRNMKNQDDIVVITNGY